MWQRCKIRIVSHPRLEAGKVYTAERDENDCYYVPPQCGYGYDTVFPDEAEEVLDEATERADAEGISPA